LEVKSKSHYFIRHKLVVVLNSLLTGLIQSSLSLSLCVCVYTRARKGAVVVVVAKRRRRDTKGKVYSSFFNSNCVLRCDGVDVFQSFKEISFPPPDGERVR
jgi:hypothetical protein